MSLESFDEFDAWSAASSERASRRQTLMNSLLLALAQRRLDGLNRNRLEFAENSIIEPNEARLLLGAVISRHMRDASSGELSPMEQDAASTYIERLWEVLDSEEAISKHLGIEMAPQHLGQVMRAASNKMSGDAILERQAVAPSNEAAREIGLTQDRAIADVNETLADMLDAHVAGRPFDTQPFGNDVQTPRVS